MKKIFIVTIICILLIFTSCKNNITENASELSEITTVSETLKEDIKDNSEDETTTDTEYPHISSPVISENVKGCFYGENTGTDKTYTGFEPLPLSDYPGKKIESDGSYDKKTIEHSYGVAKNEEPHDISKNNQKFFDEKGYEALALDNKSDDKVVYLTFDCGYENGYTGKILDVLRDKNVKAAFFCTLPEMEENPDIIARMIKEGHIVGNHSVHHPNFAELNRTEMYEELKGFDDYIREHFGYSAMYFRYPQGKYNEDSLDLINSMGFKCIFWSLAYEDWDLSAQKGAEYAFETVMARLHPGAVILLHAVSPDNAGALADIIDAARERGYEFRLISEADI